MGNNEFYFGMHMSPVNAASVRMDLKSLVYLQSNNITLYTSLKHYSSKSSIFFNELF